MYYPGSRISPKALWLSHAGLFQYPGGDVTVALYTAVWLTSPKANMVKPCNSPFLSGCPFPRGWSSSQLMVLDRDLPAFAV